MSARAAGRWLARLVFACSLSIVLAQASVRAESPVPVRPMLVRWSGHAVSVSFSAGDFLTPAVVRKLESGLPQTLVTRVYAYPEHDKEPIAFSLRSCRVVYDLWEELYRVQLQSDASERTFTTRELDAAVRACVAAKDLSLGDAFASHGGERIYFAVLIELNPLSPSTVERMRRWLSRSGAQQLEGDAFFGSFVSIFVTRRMGSAERSFSFRTPVQSVPK